MKLRNNARHMKRIVPFKVAMEKTSSDVGQEYFYGDSKKRDYRRAFPHLLDAALTGDAHCQNLVGYCYDLGLGVKKDPKQASIWYQRAAKQEHKEASYNLAILCEKGLGVETNYRKAFLLYKRAADLGDAWAQCNLGVMYLEGTGTRQNIPEGMTWLRKAARRGDAAAQYNIAIGYRDGVRARRNLRLAKIWLRKASAQGHKKAAMVLKRLSARRR